MGIRSIASSYRSVIEIITQLVHLCLQSNMRNLPPFILRHYRIYEGDPFPEDCNLASIDVSSLTTNIPPGEGKLTAMQAVADKEDSDPRQPPVEVIVGELIDIAFQNNIILPPKARHSNGH